LDLDFGVRANKGRSVTGEFRHMTCFPASTQPITVMSDSEIPTRNMFQSLDMDTGDGSSSESEYQNPLS